MRTLGTLILAFQSQGLAGAVEAASKVRLLADEHFEFCMENRPLAVLYFLGEVDQEEVTISPMRGHLPVLETLKHCFLLGLNKPDILEANFKSLVELSRLKMTYKLDFPRQYQALAQVRQAILRHLNQRFDRLSANT